MAGWLSDTAVWTKLSTFPSRAGVLSLSLSLSLSLFATTSSAPHQRTCYCLTSKKVLSWAEDGA
jgi:hypothetical protein